MKKKSFQLALILCSTVFISIAFLGLTQQQEPWRPDQLKSPAELAATIVDSTAKQPVIISVGPGGVIPHSIEVGPTSDPANLKKFEARLKSLSKDSEVIIYCGCCPFHKCPNIRPAFKSLNAMGFNHHKLLNLPENIKADWINHGYPVSE